ncbi:NAD(P)H-hydrate dehydratase [Comamonas testosteroni]|uniref:NAD(P)H-hydrate dehydratase n=1 Tax=Comamonas testosteroni TaxID=285 RepID=UPI0025E9943A|nr:NAD(P)H-hydrate dehydratase [Comamonas testosteroni]MEB5964328.1 NAD(P)H-hydrate dehydratase [Comamonas testosteroni]
MLRISSIDTPPASASPGQGWPLFSTAATRRIEQACASGLPPHRLMERAGLAIARLAMAIAPHAQRIWIACGPGNNGGDGFEAAAQLRTMLPHAQVMVSEVRAPAELPSDARISRNQAGHAGVQWTRDAPADLGPQDLCIDALLGIGLSPRPSHKASTDNQRLLQLLDQVRQCACTVLCVDLASGLDADTGQYLREFAHAPSAARQPRHTLALLTLKPGLFTGQGRDACGHIWWDDLGCGIAAPPDSAAPAAADPSAYLSASGPAFARARPHASHKGSFGDVAVLGGEGLGLRGRSMTGAAWLAALAALHAGAGRVMLALLDEPLPQGIAPWPEIMLRQPAKQDWSQATVVCGCGGGEAVKPWLPQVLNQAPQLVMDADALNAVAASPTLAQQLSQRAARQQGTVLTPHPLEAARLLETSTVQVQADRLQSCLQLARKFQCTVLLKGSGTVVANPQQQAWINASGNARLATGGTGDVLAGLIAALWAQGLSADMAAIAGAFRHGQLADRWPADRPFSASALAMQLGAA